MTCLTQAAGLLVNVLPIVNPAIVLAAVEFFLPSSGRGFTKNLALPTGIFLLGWTWLSFVTAYVPEPYLDEIFHIPQAQKYCEGKFLEWDDKITTPPGLYLLTIGLMRLRVLHAGDLCSPMMLRSFNVWAIALVAWLAAMCRRGIEKTTSGGLKRGTGGVSGYSIYTGFNVALFPVLFFFSGLYYTDVISTVSVLLAYLHHLNRLDDTPSVGSDIGVILLGVFTLFMRQTSVFWVVVYMGGLEVVHAVKGISKKKGFKKVERKTEISLVGRLTAAWKQYANGEIHDPSMDAAWPDDIIFSLLSIAIATLHNPLPILRQIWPHITTLSLFAAFVSWNGGVVLGDKSNHVATVHLAQMLYIWPLFALFSFPLFIPAFLSGLTTLVALPGMLSRVFSKEKAATVGRGLQIARCLFEGRWYYLPYIVVTLLLSVVVVKYNTIIHPFTLADNRHYMFYIFRYTIRRSEAMRLGLVVPYAVCRWMVWGALGSRGLAMNEPTDAGVFDNHPILDSSSQSVTVDDKQQSTVTPGYLTTLTQDSTPTSAIPASTGSLLLLATSLSLITAPLVEPRYFIIPWVMWRLLVPAWKLDSLVSTPFAPLLKIPGISCLVGFGSRFDLRLFSETAWYLVVNGVTMYVFIEKGYVWKAEDGTVLEGGVLQRFMW